ncbi:MAG: hypothetical protein S4CHLAM20_00840 [Chlamydiia bacterium]|nr:hypothetical protein [Chlamydiia bacterium]
MISRRLIIYFSLTLLLAVGFAYYTKEDKPQEVVEKEAVVQKPNKVAVESTSEPKKQVNQIRRFFSRGIDKFPIVETVTYTSRVEWLKGRPAWIADYASHYNTSRHFIARSLNGKEDYISQKVSPGDNFNILKPDKEVSFHLLVDLSKCTAKFSYEDHETNEIVEIKTYPVGVGRKDSYSPSGCLTPLGKYKLGQKIAIYKRGVENYFQNKKTHMMEIFGTRWIPFAEEVENCTDSAKGYGIHGLPFIYNEEKDEYIEDISVLGQYDSDGCLRFLEKDINEIFSIVITKPTYVEIVKGSEDESSIRCEK